MIAAIDVTNKRYNKNKIVCGDLCSIGIYLCSGSSNESTEILITSTTDVCCCIYIVCLYTNALQRDLERST